MGPYKLNISNVAITNMHGASIKQMLNLSHRTASLLGGARNALALKQGLFPKMALHAATPPATASRKV